MKPYEKVSSTDTSYETSQFSGRRLLAPPIFDLLTILVKKTFFSQNQMIYRSIKSEFNAE